jgi:co-chaperonin GroES (HSP10)
MSNVEPIDKETLATATQLPAPQGYRVLCAVPDIDDTFDNGIIKTTETIKTEEILATVLFVVELGPDCYKDIDKFPSGPYCKKGDFVLIRPHTGTKINIHGKAFRLINDDSVEAVVDDPRGIQRQ